MPYVAYCCPRAKDPLDSFDRSWAVEVDTAAVADTEVADSSVVVVVPVCWILWLKQMRELPLQRLFVHWCGNFRRWSTPEGNDDEERRIDRQTKTHRFHRFVLSDLLFSTNTFLFRFLQQRFLNSTRKTRWSRDLDIVRLLDREWRRDEPKVLSTRIFEPENENTCVKISLCDRFSEAFQRTFWTILNMIAFGT